VNDVIAAPIETPKTRRTARAAKIIVGLVFIASAVLKAADVNAFIVQIARYGVMVMAFQAGVALLVLLAETGLGMLLVLGVMRRFAILFSFLMLVFFTVVVFYGWLSLGMDDCGCMGLVKMHPAVSIVKNVVLIALVLVANRSLIAERRAERPPRSWRRRFARLGLVLVALAVAVGITAYATKQVEPVQAGIMGAKPFATFVFKEGGQTYDLSKGEYFVAVVSLKCPHCRASVAPMNEMRKREGFPTVVALTKGQQSRLDRWLEQTKPEFPVHLVSVQDFYRLIGFAIPRFALVRDGSPVKVWDGHLPPAEEVEKARGEAAPAGATP
jgi:uncharacterized membrane protein YphA (DoxX/SURF4 family)